NRVQPLSRFLRVRQVAVRRDELGEEPAPDLLTVVRCRTGRTTRKGRGRNLRVGRRTARCEHRRDGQCNTEAPHLAPPSTMRCENARSTASQNWRNAPYSSGWIRDLSRTNLVFTVSLPGDVSTETE